MRRVVHADPPHRRQRGRRLLGGFAAGIDLSLYVVGRLLHQEAAGKTAHQMEHTWGYA